MSNTQSNIPTKKTIYLIRHGETEFNRQGIVQGSGVDSDLNELGRAQAEAFYQSYKNINFDKVYTSALKRTHQSVHKFIESGIPWEQHSGLNEISWGIREGRVPNDIDNEYYKVLIESWVTGGVDMAAEGGESPLQVLERQKPAIETILSRPHEETVLVAMHGRAMRIILTMLLDKPLHEMDTFEHSNLCLYKLIYDYETQSFFAELECDTTHLFGL
ncbi:histidine phosphatase family protein [Cellulophaga sp. BC115SP]|uniref:histidine phosphatase family protein n=1 Tax=Cellulophaga sp. BC115SP TaxID=2683263 RepID=UPI001413681C|nr:histidine phosphatase family protein [Cellulophaga sp. BC115SP]NBB27481.1 histidine phosphatase family protein [Cellulophaga sp. BC115SP]